MHYGYVTCPLGRLLLAANETGLQLISFQHGRKQRRPEAHWVKDERPLRMVDLLWRLSARVDSRIEPIPCGARQWEDDDASAIVEIARRHGEQVLVSASTPKRSRPIPS